MNQRSHEGMQPNTCERRLFERFEVDISARIREKESHSRGQSLFLKASNISAEGAFFPTRYTMPVQRPLKFDLFLKFDLRTKTTFESRMYVLSVTGEVIRIEPSGMAVRFNHDYDINPLEARMLANRF